MRFSDFLRFDSARILVRQQLVPGRVIYYPIDFGNPAGPENKFVILAGRREEHFLVFVISTEPPLWVRGKPYLLNQQVQIDAAQHDFLDYDSTINCAKLRPLPVSDVEKRLAKSPSDVKCCVSAAIRAVILATVAKYGVLSDVDKRAVAEYLGAAT